RSRRPTGRASACSHGSRRSPTAIGRRTWCDPTTATPASAASRPAPSKRSRSRRYAAEPGSRSVLAFDGVLGRFDGLVGLAAELLERPLVGVLELVDGLVELPAGLRARALVVAGAQQGQRGEAREQGRAAHGADLYRSRQPAASSRTTSATAS